MSPHDRWQTTGIYIGPLEPEETSHGFQSVGEGREVDPREYDRQQIHRTRHRTGCGRIIGCRVVAVRHSPQKCRLETAIVDQDRILNRVQDGQEPGPYSLFLLGRVRPQAVLHRRTAISDSHADQVVEIAVGQAFDVQIHRRPFNLELRSTHGVNLLFPDGQGLQRVVILLPLVPQSLGTPTWSEGV